MWLGLSESEVSESDLQWQQLPPAPFSPRADMQTVTNLVSVLNGTAHVMEVVFIGGQLSHGLCGLYELGECAAEVWRLRFTAVFAGTNPAHGFTVADFHWPNDTQQPDVLPFAARCGAAVLPGSLTKALILLGGQATYSDSSCSSPPITLNDVWLLGGVGSRTYNYSEWQQDDPAPFSPRAFMRREELLAPASDSVYSRYKGWSTPLTGGLRVLYVTAGSTSSSPRATLQTVEVFAEVFLCRRLLGRYAGCHWGWPQDGNDSSSSPLPITSSLLPLGRSADAVVRGNWALAGQRFSGWTAQEAVQDWQHTRPAASAASSYNWTVLLRNEPSWGDDSEVATQRSSLPLSYNLSTRELADRRSPYHRGSHWTVATSPWVATTVNERGRISYELERPSTSTLQSEPYSMARTPGEAQPWLPQAASSEATERPLFRVELPRLDAAYDEWSVALTNQQGFLYSLGGAVHSGGRRGEEALSDWLETGESRCLPPDDPSFLPVLGALRWWSLDPPVDWDVSFATQAAVQVRCQTGWHFSSPVLLSDAAQFFCAPNGLWVDYQLLAPRTCVRNAPLNCSAPLINRGGNFCQPPRPAISGLSVVEGGRANVSMAISDFPLTPGTLLRVNGSFFSSPLQVTVGQLWCEGAELSGPEQWLCYNRTANTVSGALTYCAFFAHALTCVVPSVLGINLPVFVTSGVDGLTAEALDLRVATISSPAPVITTLYGWSGPHRTPDNFVCEYGPSKLHLWNCPSQQQWNLTVCVSLQTSYAQALNVFASAFADELSCVEDASEQNRGAGEPSRCVVCPMPPFLGTQQIRVQPGRSSLSSSQHATVSTRPCSAGYWTNYAGEANFTALNDSSAVFELCVPCLPGFSTVGIAGPPACAACRPGEVAPNSAMDHCQSCRPGYFFGDSNGTTCLDCPVNSYQPKSGSSHCLQCDAGEYVVYRDAKGRADGNCTRCPDGAICSSAGNITAEAGAFLAIDQTAGTVSSWGCDGRACLSGLDEACAGESPYYIARSGVAVSNCCGAGRYPAFTPDWASQSILLESSGVNPLCSVCLPGHTQISGQCVECRGVQWGPLVAMLLLFLVTVYALHRVRHDWTGVATMSIVAYFLQQSALFLSGGVSLRGLSLLNLNMLGDTGGHSQLSWGANSATAPTPVRSIGWCVVPMESETERMVGALVSICVMFGLLGVLWLLQLLVMVALRHRSVSHLSKLFAAVFIAEPPRISPGAYQNLSRALLEEPTSSLPIAVTAGGASPHAADKPSALPIPETKPDEEVCAAPQSVVPGTNLRSLLTRQRSEVRSMPKWLAYQRTAVRLVQLSYTALTLLSIRYFHTRRVGQFGTRLVDYPALRTDSSGYIALLPLMLVLLTIVASLPLAVAVFLFRQSRAGKVAELKERAEELEFGGLSSLEALTLQLTCMFRANCWWMAALIPLRRLALALVFVFAEGQSNAVGLTLVNFLLLAAHLQLPPYERAVDNQYETLCLLCLALQTTVLSLYPLPMALNGVMAGLIVLVVVPVVVIVGPWLMTVLWRVYQRWKAVLRQRRGGEAESQEAEHL